MSFISLVSDGLLGKNLYLNANFLKSTDSNITSLNGFSEVLEDALSNDCTSVAPKAPGSLAIVVPNAAKLSPVP